MGIGDGRVGYGARNSISCPRRGHPRGIGSDLSPRLGARQRLVQCQGIRRWSLKQQKSGQEEHVEARGGEVSERESERIYLEGASGATLDQGDWVPTTLSNLSKNSAGCSRPLTVLCQ